MKVVTVLLLSWSLICEGFLVNTPLSSRQSLSHQELFSTTTDNPATKDSPAKPDNKPVNKQAEYGKSLELPETYARCGRCSTSFALTENELQGKGR